MLADLGADVVKVEGLGAGDDTRHWGPPFLQDADGNHTDQASYFTACNRNKRSVTIDMATEEGQQLIRQMAPQPDVLVENFKVGGLARYSLDYASWRSRTRAWSIARSPVLGRTGRTPSAPATT